MEGKAQVVEYLVERVAAAQKPQGGLILVEPVDRAFSAASFALTTQQLQALAKQGLYELPEPAPPDPVSTADPLEPLWVESSAPKPRRKGGRGRPKGPILEHAALVANSCVMKTWVSTAPIHGISGERC